MPYMQLYGPDGLAPVINTQNWEMAADWLREWLPRLWPARAPKDWGNPRVMIRPAIAASTDEPDWHTNSVIISQLVELPRDPDAAVERVTWLRSHGDELLPDYAREGAAEDRKRDGLLGGPLGGAGLLWRSWGEC